MILAGGVALLACAAWSDIPARATPYTASDASPAAQTPADCEAFFKALDGAVASSGVTDASTHPVPGYPHLRVTRFLTALFERADTAPQRRAWLSLASSAALRSRRSEIANLPPEALNSAAPMAGIPRADLFDQARSCSTLLLDRDASRPDIMEALAPLAVVPDEYSTFLRVFGIHPIASIPVAIVTKRVENRLRASYSTDLSTLRPAGMIKVYAPEAVADIPMRPISEILRDATQNALSVPLPSPAEEAFLARTFAPVFAMDTTGLQDRIGRVVKPGLDSPPDVDPLDSVIYHYTTRGFLEGRPVLQLNYVLWTSGRRGGKAPLIEHGRLDGLTFRVSLAPSGSPFMVDMMNNCGCYHFFVPAAWKVAGLKPGKVKEPHFVPQWLPDVPPGSRLTIRVNSGWHQVERLYTAPVPPGAIAYRIEPYASLEALKGLDGTSRSLFDKRGVAPGTERVEPLIFFPMGIPSVGSMRQRSHHAITFLGEAHFDDPYLFDDRFEYR